MLFSFLRFWIISKLMFLAIIAFLVFAIPAFVYPGHFFKAANANEGAQAALHSALLRQALSSFDDAKSPMFRVGSPAKAAGRGFDLQGKVVGVSDGDTLTLLDGRTQHKVRMLGIDAPESKQDFGQRSKQALSSMVFGQTVLARCTERDRYERSLCRIEVEGLDVNHQMIELGMAWHYAQYARDQWPGDARLYAASQKEAMAARRGLWARSDVVAPWDFRKAARGSK